MNLGSPPQEQPLWKYVGLVALGGITALLIYVDWDKQEKKSAGIPEMTIDKATSPANLKSTEPKVVEEAAPTVVVAQSETELKIAAKYDEYMKKWLEIECPPGELERIKREQRRRAEIAILHPEKLRDHDIAQLTATLARKAPKVWVPKAKMEAFLAKNPNLPPAQLALAAFLAADPTILEKSLRLHPDNADLLFAALLYDEKFLSDHEGIQKLARIQPDSPWPSLFSAIAAMKGGNTEMAARDLQRALSSEITPFENGLSESLVGLENALKQDPAIKSTKDKWDLELILRKSTNTLFSDIILGAPDFYRQHVGDPNALAFAGAALNLAERDSETPSLVGERVALMNELDILTAMGASAAQQYLETPYQELVDSLHSRRETLQNQINEVERFSKNLSANDKTQFNKLSRDTGEWQAYQTMKGK